MRVHGRVDEKRLEKLKDGISIEGINYKSIEARLDKSPEDRETAAGTNSWLTIVLREGKNREIRKVMEALGLRVNRLIRTDYGPFTLGDLTPGSVEEVRPQVLKDQVAGYFKGKQ